MFVGHIAARTERPGQNATGTGLVGGLNIKALKTDNLQAGFQS